MSEQPENPKIIFPRVQSYFIEGPVVFQLSLSLSFLSLYSCSLARLSLFSSASSNQGVGDEASYAVVHAASLQIILSTASCCQVCCPTLLERSETHLSAGINSYAKETSCGGIYGEN